MENNDAKNNNKTRMRKYAVIFGILLFIAAITVYVTITVSADKWEYKIVAFDGDKSIGGAISSTTLKESESLMLKLGQQGWELVSSFPIIQTEMQDVSAARNGYVSNIRANVRTTAISYVFKRKLRSLTKGKTR